MFIKKWTLLVSYNIPKMHDMPYQCVGGVIEHVQHLIVDRNWFAGFIREVTF